MRSSTSSAPGRASALASWTSIAGPSPAEWRPKGPSAGRQRRQLPEHRVAVLAPGRVVRERDRLDVEDSEALDRRSGPGVVVAEEGARVGQAAANDLKHVPGEQEPMPRRV